MVVKRDLILRLTSFVLYSFRNRRFGFQGVKCCKTKTRCKWVVIFLCSRPRR